MRVSKKNIKVGYVAIVGQPNVGKSTLLNNLLDFKVAAVTRKPQTTRHQIRGILNGEDHQIIFFDTPGLLEPKYKLQEAMRQAAFRSLKDADLVLFMVAAAKEPDEFDTKLLNQIHDFNSSIILLLNKMDIISKNQVLPVMEYYSQLGTLKSIMPISALKKDGLDSLKEEILSALPTGQPFYDDDQIMDHPERFIVSELIREKIFQRYGEEIPYATTVQIDEFKERNDGKDFIRAIIYVEKASQKGILIGKKGAALKDVGRIARQEIEHLLERKVFLELWVKVKEKWRQDEKMLKEFGYYN
ncbi:GTPase Era [candidate division KSB1 bacterium]|nr:GTPase Era [candidate division KSB1 bacterium]